jgi:3-methyladenine DNA glycosylase AlkD
VDEPGNYLLNTGWIGQFGALVKEQVEDYGKVTSLRVWYQDGFEVEFGLSVPDWAVMPVDSGTDRVIMDGIKVLLERKPVLSPALEGFSQAEELYAGLVQAIQAHANPQFAEQNRVWFKNADFLSYGLKAVDHKVVWMAYRKAIQRLPLRGRLYLARWLVLQGYAEPVNFANAVLSISVQELGHSDFDYLDEQLNHFHGWGHVDDFCINVLQPLLWKYPKQTLSLLQNWNRSENLWKRRASVVVFVRKVGASGQFTAPALELCENLLGDKEDLVQKGVGWALKDLMRGDKDRVLDYVKSLRRRGISATITLYAIRGLKGIERQEVLSIRNTRME